MRVTRSLAATASFALAACSSVPDPPRGTALRPAAADTVSFDVTEATRVSFDVSPDGRVLVVDLLGQLWRIPGDGGDAVLITNAVRDTAEDFEPAIAPDGRRLVFSSDRPGGRGLWLASVDGDSPRRLTTRAVGFFTYLSPAWSPDGRRVAYGLGDSLIVIDVERGVEAAVRIDSLPSGPPLPPFTPRTGLPAWSPDGARLTFVNAEGTANRGEGRIWEVAIGGGVARALTTLRGLAPAWSPDGSRLAFFARDSASRWQLHVQGRDGQARRLTSHDDVVTYRARWMRDGQWIVYVADGGLWRISANGGTPVAIPFRARVTMQRRRAAIRPVTFPPPGEERVAKGFAALALSPDARRLAMIALDSLWVGEVGGSMRALASAREAGDRALAWSPDGSALAWTQRERAGRPYDLIVTDVRTGASRALAAVGHDIVLPTWAPHGRSIAFLADGRLRVMDASGPRIERVADTRDLGTVPGGWGTLAWSPRSDGLIASAYDFALSRTSAMWIPLDGERRPLSRFPAAAADLRLDADGHGTWVENNLLWRAPFTGPEGLRGEPVPLSADPAIEARHAADGSILYLSTTGIRVRAPNGDTRALPWPLRYRAAAAPSPIVIRGARVIDGRGAPVSPPRDVLLEGGRITRIAAAGMIVGGMRVIDAQGTYLIPGLIDLHTHIWDDVSLAARLHNGVTTVRDIASQRLKTPDTRNAIEAGVREGPRVVYGGAMFHRVGVGYSTLADQMTTDSAGLARAVAIMAGMDASYLKERGFEHWSSAVRLVNEAHRHGLVVSGHCAHILPVVAAGIDGAEHVLDCVRDAYPLRSDYARLARAAGLWIVPTSALRFSMVRVTEDPQLVADPDVAPFLPPSYRPIYATDSLARRRAIATAPVIRRLAASLRRYRESEVMMATGTDSPFPLGVQHEMEMLVESGFTPMEAIVAATSGAARALNAPSIGTIAEGQWADLVLLEANPLDDVRNTRKIRAVIQGGRVVDRERLRRGGVKP